MDLIYQNAAFTVYKFYHTRMRRSDFKDGLLIYLLFWEGSYKIVPGVLCTPHPLKFFLRKTTRRHNYIYIYFFLTRACGRFLGFCAGVHGSWLCLMFSLLQDRHLWGLVGMIKSACCIVVGNIGILCKLVGASGNKRTTNRKRGIE